MYVLIAIFFEQHF